MSRWTIVGLALVLAVGCKSKQELPVTSDSNSKPPAKPSATPASAEAVARKAKSEAQLRLEGVKVNPGLPVILDKAGARPRGKDEIVDRAIALLVVAQKGEGLAQDKVLAAQTEWGAAPFLSPKEQAFVALAAPDPKTLAQFTLRYEALNVLHWSLGRRSSLEPTSHRAAAIDMVRLIKEDGAPAYRKGGTLRSVDELLDAADLVYRYHWACADARAANQPAPQGVDCDVVVERHHALNWLLGYRSQAWDDVTTDT